MQNDVLLKVSNTLHMHSIRNNGCIIIVLIKQELLYRELGLSLATERRRQRLSQKQFGAKVGLSRTSITNIECGRQPIQLHQLYVFASMLKVSVTKLLPKESAFTEATVQKSDKEAQYIADAVNALDQDR